MLKPQKIEGSTMQLPPAGTHRAVLYKIINLGTLETEYQGKKRDSQKIRLFWELPDEIVEYEFTENDQKVKKRAPFSVGRKFTLSLGDQSHLLPIITGMIGQGLTEDERWNFDVESLLGTSCLVTIVHEDMEGRKYAKVISTSPLMKGMEKAIPQNEPSLLDVRTLSQEEIENLRDYIRDDMKSSREYHVRFLAPRSELKRDESYPTEEDINVDEIPF